MMDEYKNESSDDRDRNQYPENEPLSAMTHLFLSTFFRAISGAKIRNPNTGRSVRFGPFRNKF
jgi:hypothetical protein